MHSVLDRGQFRRCDVVFDPVIKMGKVLLTLIARPVQINVSRWLLNQ